MTDDLEAKIARISARVATRNTDTAAEIRTELAAIGCLDLAEATKSRFGARLAYLKTPRIERGSAELMRPGCVWTPYTPPKVRK